MSDILDKIAEIEAELIALKRELAQKACVESGHDWKVYGYRNAGCGLYCECLIPVHTCSKCLDFDYGENAEAAEIMQNCEKREDQEDGNQTR